MALSEEGFAAAVRDIRTSLLWSVKRAGYAKTKRDRLAELHGAYAFARSLATLRRHRGDDGLPAGYDEYQITRGDFDAAKEYVGSDWAELLGEFSEFKYGLRK
jgi:hypothetical protein